MSISTYIGGQFAKPKGMAGKIAAKFMNHLNATQYVAVRKYAAKNEGERVLAIGCGNGKTIRMLRKTSKAKFYGFDISEDMITSARRVNDDGVLTNQVILQQGEVDELDFRDGYFDSVYTVNTVYFWHDIQGAMTEILRVLKSGGNFICAYYSKDFLDGLGNFTSEGFEKFQPRDIGVLAKKCGFINVSVKVLKENKSYCLVAEKG